MTGTSEVLVVPNLQKLLCLSQSKDKDELLPAAWQGEYDITFVRNPVRVLGLLQSQNFDGVFVCADSFREVLGLSDSIRDSQILKNLPDAVALLDREQRILWNNQKLADWTGSVETQSKRFIDCFVDATIIGADEDPILTAAVLGRQTVTKIKDKNSHYFDMLISPVLDKKGETSQLIVVLRDITTETLQNQKLEAIHMAGIELANLTPEEIFQMDVTQRIDLLKSNILHYTQQVLDYSFFEIRLVDDKSGMLEALLSVGINSERAQQPLYVSTEGQGVTGFVAATGRSYICDDTTKDPIYLDGLIGAGSCLTVPLIVHDHVIGTINVESPEIKAFSRSDLQFLEIFSRDIAASLNTLELLAAQSANAAQQSVEAIHSAVALPIDEILNDAVSVLEKYIGHDSEVEQRLRSILKNARDVKQVIQKVGEKMAPATAVPECLQTPCRPLLQQRRILVIDSDAEVRDSAHRLLERYGCIVETAHFGREALSMIRNSDGDHQYDTVISELRLEDMTGYDLLMNLKDLMGIENPPLILMTGFGYDPGHTMVKARKAGLRPNAVLYKPFRLDQLLDTVERFSNEEASV